MSYKQMKELIPLYLDGELEPSEQQQFEKYLSSSLELQKELKSFAKAWEMMGDLPEIKPDPAYVSKFWTKVSVKKHWYQILWEYFRSEWVFKPYVPVLATLCSILVVVSVYFYQFQTAGDTGDQLASLDATEIEIIENIELVENYDIIEDIEFLEDFEVIEQLESFDLSYAV